MDLTGVKQELLKKYRYRIEAHAHTSPISSCSEISVSELIEAYAKLEYNGIVITNHFMYDYGTCMRNNSVEDGVKKYLSDYYEAVELGKKYGIAVLLGSEIRFTENNNDYLVYGVDEKMLKEIYGYLQNGLENFRKNYGMPQSVFLLAHPFRDGREEVDPKLLDGIEVFNMHPGHNSRIAVASMYAKEKNVEISIAGSDFHFLRGRCLSVSAILTQKMPKDSFEFAQILKSKDYLMEIGRNAVIFP